MNKPSSTITIAAGNGLELTAATEEWVAGLILSLSPQERARVMALIQTTIKGPLVCAPPAPGPSGISIAQPPVLLRRGGRG